MKLVLITADPALASRAQRAGVGRIMVDLERIGKFERQMFRDTWISKHELSDIAPVAEVLEESDLMVRINPLYVGSRGEIDSAIESGAQFIMLPMFTSIAEVESIGEMIGGRCGLVPLVETGDALSIIDRVARCDAVSEVFVGLNDLHLSLSLDFMFEPLVNGLLEEACGILASSGKPYGFGGVARVGEGDLSADLIMREHARLGSTRVNLSRTFARSDAEGDIKVNDGSLRREVAKLLDVYGWAQNDDAEQRAKTQANAKRQVESIIARMRDGE